MKLDYAAFNGAWRMLCASAVYDALVVLSKPKARAEDRKIVRNWIEKGDVGALTFNECSEALGYGGEILRKKILEARGKLLRKPAFKRQATLYGEANDTSEELHPGNMRLWQTRNCES
jgi:hypothetical protein